MPASPSLLWQGWFTEITPFCSVVWLCGYYSDGGVPGGNPPIGACRSSSSHISSVVRWVQISPSPPALFLTGAVCEQSPKLVFPAVWKSPDADPLLGVKPIRMYSMKLLCCNWIMPGNEKVAAFLQRKWTRKKKTIIWIKCWLKRSL